MKPEQTASRGVIRALGVATLLCAFFYGLRLWQLGALAFSYLPWNLFLAWIPLGLSMLLLKYLRQHAWSDWPGLTLSIIWLLFLPNSFYLVSDYIHLQDVSPASALYDSVMFTMFVITGMLLGYSSLAQVHLEFRKRLTRLRAGVFVTIILLLCSLAMYIGRDLRWNSWDVLASPSGLLFDLSNRFVHLSQYKEMIGTVALFFAFLTGLYFVGWRLVYAARQAERPLLKTGPKQYNDS